MKDLCWLFVMLISIPATAADNDDSGGWRKAKWGMTVKQVAAAFQGSKYRLVPIKAVDGPNMDGLLAIDGCVDLQIPKMTVTEPKCFYVWFGFTKTTPATLIHVDLKPDEPPSFWDTWAFTQLRGMLTDKYGLPAYEQKNEPDNQTFFDTFVWKLPTSRIKLMIFGLNLPGKSARLVLQYMKAPDADNL